MATPITSSYYLRSRLNTNTNQSCPGDMTEIPIPIPPSQLTQPMTRSSSGFTKQAVQLPESFSMKMTKQVQQLIEKNGWNSCQLVRTFGLVIYALFQLEYAGDKYSIFKQFLQLLYPYTILKDTTILPNLDEYITSQRKNLEYLRLCVSFSNISQVNHRRFVKNVGYYNGNVKEKCDEIECEYILTYTSKFASTDLIPFDDGRIHTFAIINPNVEDSYFRHCPIHYFNIAYSESLKQLCYYTAWAGDNINCKWAKIPFDRIDEFFDMPSLLTRVMLTPENLIGPGRLPTAFNSSLLSSESEDPNIQNYVVVVNDLLAKNLYVVEILSSNQIIQNSQPEGSRDPLIETFVDVLREFTSQFPIQQPGGYKKQRKKRTKITKRKSKKSKKRTRKTLKSR